MARTYLSIHDASRELYDGLPADEQTAEATAWKTIETPGIKITFFEPAADASNDA